MKHEYAIRSKQMNVTDTEHTHTNMHARTRMAEEAGDEWAKR